MPRTPKPTTWTVSRDADTQFIEAAKWFLGRVPMTKERWSELTERAQRKAFTVAGVTQADVLNSVFRAVDSAVAKGTTLADFKRDVGPKLESEWQGTVANPPWRLETIFRTNIQMAYSSGRVRQMKDPAVSNVRPFWLYDSVLDTRTSEICRPLAGTVLPADDAFWKTHTPPSHFGCRSGIRALRKSQAEARGITSPPPNGPAAKGFGNDPDESEWSPDLNRYPPELREQVRKRLDEMPDPKPMAMPKPAPVPPPAPTAPSQAAKQKSSKPATPGIPPEHTPAHWIATYAHLGPEAADACARARANMERVLDWPPAKVKAAFEKSPWADDALIKHLFARDSAATSATLRDMLSGPVVLPSTRRTGERCAALVGNLARPKGNLDIEIDNGTKDKKLIREVKKAQKQIEAVLGPGLNGHKVIAYQMRHGSMKMVEPGNRAFCMGNTVVVDVTDDAHVFIHEAGHAIEHGSGKAQKAAFQFYESRTKGEPLEPLATVTGNTNYRPNEVTRKDKFFDAYVGKDYSVNGQRDASEVLSMGLQYIFQDSDLLYRDDPEHFMLTLGVVNSP